MTTVTPWVWLPVGIGVYVAGLLLYDWWRNRNDPPPRPHGYGTIEEAKP